MAPEEIPGIDDPRTAAPESIPALLASADERVLRALIENPSGLSTTSLKVTAAQLGLDPVSFDACLDGRKYESAVVADRTQGERIGAHGTSAASSRSGHSAVVC